MNGQVVLFGNNMKQKMGVGCLLKSGGLDLCVTDNLNEMMNWMDKSEAKLLIYNFGNLAEKEDMDKQSEMSRLSVIRNMIDKPVIGIGEEMEEMFRILALNCGLDDCVDANCNPLEIVARIYAQIRFYDRLSQMEKKSVICLEGLEVDDQAKMVRVEGHLVDLTPTEYKILHLLMEEPGKVFSNKQIYERIWKMSPVGADNTVAVHVRHIREKIESNPQEPKYLRVVWGQGYKVG